MILRALFWISVVAVLMPHEPGLSLAGLTGARTTSGTMSCADHAGTCATALSMLDAFQSTAIRNLAEVKADIAREEHRHARTSDAHTSND